jgi:hypothetical protein
MSTYVDKMTSNVSTHSTGIFLQSSPPFFAPAGATSGPRRRRATSVLRGRPRRMRRSKRLVVARPTRFRAGAFGVGARRVLRGRSRWRVLCGAPPAVQTSTQKQVDACSPCSCVLRHRCIGLLRLCWRARGPNGMHSLIASSRHCLGHITLYQKTLCR